MSLIQSLPEGPLDIVGDIHGEFDALLALLSHLGYDLQGHHPQGRTLVFVGDFCDRGPDSPAVLALVQKLVQSGRAAAVLGNHEINLLREDAKDGSGWFLMRVSRVTMTNMRRFGGPPRKNAKTSSSFYRRCPSVWNVPTCA